MRVESLSVLVTALCSLLAAVDAARHGHSHAERHNTRSVAEVGAPVQRRDGQCQFPADAGLVAVTPTEQNAGWAMSPNQPCLPGNYCPYACPPGQVMMQWDPQATSYTYPLSMNGGLYCDENGDIHKPFPDKPYCQDGTGAVSVVNNCGSFVSFCQTVLPGNEAMLIPTLVTDTATLAVPDTSYWCETAAHYYINPPGVNVEEACVWGTSTNPFGNWSPYVAGANTDTSGNTFVKIGWNPIYLQPTTPFRDQMPEFGVEITCEGNSCNGLPCKIDPAVNGVNEMIGSITDGAGGGAFCVVTVPPGEKANIVLFNMDGSTASSGPGPAPGPSSSPSADSAATSSAAASSDASTATASAAASTISVAPLQSHQPVPLFGEGGPAGAVASGYPFAPGMFVETSSSMSAPTAVATAAATATSSKSSASAVSISLGLVASAFVAVVALAM